MSLRREMITGVFWSTVQKYSGLVVQLVVSAVLARLIAPEDFGVVAVAMVLIIFFSMFADMGVGAAIIQRQDFTQKDWDAIYSVTVYVGTVLALLFFFASYPIADFYDNRTLIPICQLLSVNVLCSSLNIVPNALINKNKRFKFIAIRTLVFQIVSGVAAVMAALSGAGLYALLVAPVFTSVGVFIVNLRQYPLRFIPRIEMATVKSIFSYSGFLLLFNVFNYFSRNLDKLIIGRYFSARELGYYDMSYRLMMLPLQNVTHVVTPVMHPILTSLQMNLGELSAKYNRIVSLIANLSFPLTAFLYFAADNLIHIVYGDRWNDAIPVFEILSLSLPLQMILASIGAIYLAAGRTDWMFYNGMCNTIFTILGFVVAAVVFHTIDAMAWAWDITLTINFFISYWILYKIVLKSSFWRMLTLNLNPLIVTGIIAVVLFFVEKLSIDNCVLSLCVQFVVSAVIALVWGKATGRYDLIGLLKQMKAGMGSKDKY